MKNRKDISALLAFTSILASQSGLRNMFKLDDDPVVLDWQKMEEDYNLIQEKKSKLSRKAREEVIYLWEKRVKDGLKDVR